MAAALATPGGFAVLTAAGCAPDDPEAPSDAFQPLLDAARIEAELFAAANGRLGDSAPRVRAAGDVRRRHAEVLAAEIDRVHGPATTTAAVEGTPPEPAECPPLGEVRARLQASARAAGTAAEDASGYRASLAAAVAAACTAAAEVLLG